MSKRVLSDTQLALGIRNIHATALRKLESGLFAVGYDLWSDIS